VQAVKVVALVELRVAILGFSVVYVAIATEREPHELALNRPDRKDDLAGLEAIANLVALQDVGAEPALQQIRGAVSLVTSQGFLGQNLVLWLNTVIPRGQ
jgi:hypothetical protein